MRRTQNGHASVSNFFESVAEVLPWVHGCDPQKELRNHIGEVLRRVEAGESLTVTVAGRPVAELRPAERRRWVHGPALAQVWKGPAPRDLEDDLTRLDADVVNPFAS